MGDSRTGAGEGDDEMIKVDLNAIPFDVMKINFVLSVYDQDAKGDNLQDVKNVYWRVVDEEDRLEVVCFPVPEEDLTTATAMLVVSIVREGPQWFVEPLGKPIVGGLARAATTYDIIVQELMSTEFDDENFEDDFEDSVDESSE
jgi:tellurium resistance protein TerD